MLYNIKGFPKSVGTQIDISKVSFIHKDSTNCELLIGIAGTTLKIPIDRQVRLNKIAPLLMSAWEEHKKAKVVDIEDWQPKNSDQDIVMGPGTYLGSS